jgi:hypothetical protein
MSKKLIATLAALFIALTLVGWLWLWLAVSVAPVMP